jgi:uncharacterized membrane protein
MRSPSETQSPARDAARLTARAFSLCLLMGASLQIMENVVPRLPLFPWLKLGISHLILLPFLLRYGTRSACMLLLGRNLLSLLFAGGALTTFLIGGASGTAALLAGGWLVRAGLRRKWLGLIGAGMLLAALMNMAQLVVAEGLIVRQRAFFFQLAPMLLWSLVSGAAVAWLAYRALPVLEELFDEADDAPPKPEPAGGGKPPGYPWAFTGWLAATAGLFLLPGERQPLWQGLALAALLAASALAGRGFMAALKSLARGWPWFLYLAWLHLFLGDGELLWGWVTRPGALAFLFYSLRLASLILLGPLLAKSFPTDRLSRSPSVYARGLVGSLPLLPGLHAAAMRAAGETLRKLRGGETSVLRGMLEGFRESLARAG